SLPSVTQKAKHTTTLTLRHDRNTALLVNGHLTPNASKRLFHVQSNADTNISWPQQEQLSEASFFYLGGSKTQWIPYLNLNRTTDVWILMMFRRPRME
ncbi:hypothetical protein, partial [Serratia fonticola]